MFTFQVHKFRDSQSEGGDLERNTCAKHICLRAVVADDLVGILWFFWSLCPWKEASWLLKTSLFKQLSRNSTDHVSLLNYHLISMAQFFIFKKRSASTTLYNSKLLFLIHNAFIADRNFVLGNAQVADLPIIYCNDGFCELTGYSRAELVQKHCSCDFLCGENTNEFSAREVKEALRGQEEKHVEILYYRKDGKIKSITIILAFLNTKPVCNELWTTHMKHVC